MPKLHLMYSDLTDLIVIAAIAVAVILVGLGVSRLESGLRSYVSADGRISWISGGISVFMSFFSAGTFVVWGSIAYQQGLVGITIQETICVAGLITALLIAPRWKRTGAMTVADYLKGRFGSEVQKTYSILFFVMAFFSAASFLYPVASLLSLYCGLSIGTCTILIGAACILYSSIGGIRSVIATDIMKFVILGIAVLVVVPLSIRRAGGAHNMISSMPEGFLSPVGGEYTWLFMVAFCLYNSVQLGGNWANVQKFNSLRSDKDARKASFLFAALYLINPVLWMIPCLAYRSIDAGLAGSEVEGVFLLSCKSVLPTGVLGFMLAGLILTSMSSINAMLNSTSSVFANDIMPYMRRSQSEKGRVVTARIACACAGLVITGIALLIPRMGGIVNVIISLAALAGAPLYLPAIWSLYSRALDGRRMMLTTFVSLGINILCKFALPLVAGVSLSRGLEMALGVALPILILSSFETQYTLSINPKTLN